MIIGHNPAMAILLNRLADDQDIAPSMLHFPTGHSHKFIFLEKNSKILNLKKKESCFFPKGGRYIIVWGHGLHCLRV